MGPNNPSQVPSGHLGPECLVERGGYGADVGRMIIIYRWLYVWQPDTHRPKTIVEEPDMMDSTFSRGTIGSLNMYPAATNCCSPVWNNRISHVDRTEKIEWRNR